MINIINNFREKINKFVEGWIFIFLGTTLSIFLSITIDLFISLFFFTIFIFFVKKWCKSSYSSTIYKVFFTFFGLGISSLIYDLFGIGGELSLSTMLLGIITTLIYLGENNKNTLMALIKKNYLKTLYLSILIIVINFILNVGFLTTTVSIIVGYFLISYSIGKNNLENKNKYENDCLWGMSLVLDPIYSIKDKLDGKQ